MMAWFHVVPLHELQFSRENRLQLSKAFFTPRVAQLFHCGSAFEPGASGLPYYCTSICVCVPDVIGALAVFIFFYAKSYPATEERSSVAG